MMYNVGVQVNPINNLVLDVAYEGSQENDGDRNHSINVSIGMSIIVSDVRR